MYKVVVGVDGSPESERALVWAIEAARQRDASVAAVHAWQSLAIGDPLGVATVDPHVLEEAGQAILDACLDRVDVGELRSPVEAVLMTGPASTALVEASEDADLVVVGSRGRGGFAGLLLGSVSHRLVQHARKPVVVVPHTWGGTQGGRIVVGIDGSGNSLNALFWALDWARPSAASVDAVLAFDPQITWIDVHTDHEQRWLANATAQAETEVRGIMASVGPRSEGVNMRPEVAAGPPARVLLDEAKDADLLVVGTRGRGGFAGLLLGSVSQRCVEHSACPVAVIPTTT